jgi:TonB family protein
MLASQKLTVLILSINILVSSQSPARSNSSNSTMAQASPQTTFVLEPVRPLGAIYPPVAQEGKIQGEILALILVSEAGAVENIHVLKADDLLSSAAQEAMKKWEFKPVMEDGNAIPVVSKVTFNFVLADNSQNATVVLPDIAPATKFPKRVRVSTEVMKGLILKYVDPVYPREARVAGQGRVLIQETISKEGKVMDLKVVSGHPLFSVAAIEAVKQWRYKTYLRMGRPVEVETLVQVDFFTLP